MVFLSFLKPVHFQDSNTLSTNVTSAVGINKRQKIKKKKGKYITQDQVSILGLYLYGFEIIHIIIQSKTQK
uniref:Uncharacterized protein n=1 Tax=Rhizophora mucronata TaxID=61149 RepID=A0A2P2QKZ4_RHIMU